jgi:hypothetical protein
MPGANAAGRRSPLPGKARRQQAVLDAVAADPELRTAALAVEWRLNVPHEQAARVAVLVQPRNRWEADRVEAVVLMPLADLVDLARSSSSATRTRKLETGRPITTTTCGGDSMRCWAGGADR